MPSKAQGKIEFEDTGGPLVIWCERAESSCGVVAGRVHSCLKQNSSPASIRQKLSVCYVGQR